MNTTIIGIDSAVEDKNIGLFCITLENNNLKNVEIRNRKPFIKFEEQIKVWIENAKGRILLAVDTPMGYPKNFGEAIKKHQAGGKIMLSEFPRRETDKNIKEKYGITPLDIASNLISRTTYSTLNRISSIGQFSLIWDNKFDKFGMIEVYPKATLIANSIKENYKGNKSENNQKRKEILEKLKQKYPLENCFCPKNENDFDALICCLAGFDFIVGKSNNFPKNKENIVKKEGWIWVK